MGLLAEFLGLRRTGRKTDGNGTAKKSQYRCAQVCVGQSGGCAAAAALADRRFLPDVIPTLPLPDCPKQACDCHFELHEDRRREPRPGSDVNW